jgi:RNA polymerase sigma-54 factor
MEKSHLRMNMQIQQRQTMTLALYQAMQILQMPQMELAEWIRVQIECNPLIDYTERPSPCVKPSLPPVASVSLREHLQRQAYEAFADAEDLQVALWIIDRLDERGWFRETSFPYDQQTIERVLLAIQIFDPPGIGARCLQECLWLQLRSSGASTAEILVRNHFNDLLQGHFAHLQKKLRLSESALTKALQRIARLHLRPSSAFDHPAESFIVPDLSIEETDRGWQVSVCAAEVPAIRIRNDYIGLIPELPSEEKQQLRAWVASARWIRRCLYRRHQTLQTIGQFLVRTQMPFLSQTGSIRPIEITQLAGILQVHSSTAWRAVTNKIAACPSGFIELKKFFSKSSATNPIKEKIRQMIETEEKDRPLHDEEIMLRLQQAGIRCARRTVAKYRHSLYLAKATQRKIIRDEP